MTETFWQRVLKFNDEHFPNWRKVSLLYYATALGGETGEVQNAVKHLIGGGTNRPFPEMSFFEEGMNKIAEECVDLRIYIDLLLARLGFTEEQFEQVVNRKYAELEARMKDKVRLLPEEASE